MTIKSIIIYFIPIHLLFQLYSNGLNRRQLLKDRFVELNTSATMKQATILYSKGDVLLRGIDNIPSSLIATPDFTPFELPNEFRNNLDQLHSILFNHGYGTGRVFTSGEYTIPQWLSQQMNLKLLELRFFKLNDLKILQNLPLEYLLLSNVSVLNRQQIIKDLENMRQLKYLVQDDIFTSNEIADIKKHLPRLKCLSIREYTKKIIDKQIVFDKI